MKPIAYIESVYKENFATPRQSGLVPNARGIIHFERWVQPEESLCGLESFSHIWVSFLFHKNTNKHFNAKVCPPRLSGEKLGVFATRSPHRPNSLGLSLLKLEQVHSDRIDVSGVDLVDGTPILDVKPYLRESECVENADVGWTENISSQGFVFSWEKDIDVESEYKKLVEETLRLDPRPNKDKKENLNSNYVAHIGQYDVKFKIDRGVIEILETIKDPKSDTKIKRQL